MPPRRKSEAPDPEVFVREQISRHMGCEITGLDDPTIVRGGVLRNIMTALERKIGYLEPANLLSSRLDGRYTVKQCVRIVRASISCSCASDEFEE